MSAPSDIKWMYICFLKYQARVRDETFWNNPGERPFFNIRFDYYSPNNRRWHCSLVELIHGERSF